MTEILLILLICGYACSIIGVFTVLRNLSMLTDAISHSILLGIVLAFMMTSDLSSPLLFIGAVVMGVITVLSTESLIKFAKIKEDSAVGLVFPFFFSLGVILLSRDLANTHLCVDTVLMGEVLMAPFRRVELLGMSIPLSLRNLGFVTLLNLVVVTVFYKELKVSTFDREFSKISGFSVIFLNYLITVLISITAVSAFDAVGTILVISFLVAPAASAHMLSKNLAKMILISLAYATVNSVVGFFIAFRLNVNISGTIAAVAGINYLLTVVLNPNGVITSAIRRKKQRETLLSQMLLTHIANHEGTAEESRELGIETISNHMKWSRATLQKRADRLVKNGLIKQDENLLCRKMGR